MDEESKLELTQSKVYAVKEVMSENIAKALHRGEALEDLENKSQSLQDQSAIFYKTAVTVKRNERRKAWMMKIGIVVGFLVVVMIVVLVIYSAVKRV